MKESLYDKFTDDHGCVDFGRSSGMSQHKEAKRFLAALQRKSELQQKAVFEVNVSAQGAVSADSTLRPLPFWSTLQKHGELAAKSCL